MASSADNDAMRTDSPEAEMPEERTSGDSADVTLPQVDFLAMQFPSSDREGEFATPEPSSGRHHSDDLADTFGDMTAAQRREIVADACRLDPAYAQRVLDSYSGRQLGWCELVSLVPTKENGYVQLSYGGVNKFAMLQRVLLWAAGSDLSAEKDQCSHLCPHRVCKTVGHVIAESAEANNGRKGCRVWVDCHHCGKKIFVCLHDPFCIKFCEGFSSPEDFLTRGVCRILRDDA